MKLATWAYAVPQRPTRTQTRSASAAMVDAGTHVRIIGRRLGGIVIVEPLGMPGWAIPIRAEHVVEGAGANIGALMFPLSGGDT